MTSFCATLQLWLVTIVYAVVDSIEDTVDLVLNG